MSPTQPKTAKQIVANGCQNLHEETLFRFLRSMGEGMGYVNMHDNSHPEGNFETSTFTLTPLGAALQTISGRESLAPMVECIFEISYHLWNQLPLVMEKGQPQPKPAFGMETWVHIIYY
jgi:hypothetical protein